MNNLRLYSFRKLLSGFNSMLSKYPLLTGIALLKTVLVIWQIDLDYTSGSKDQELSHLLLRISLVMFLALPLFYTLHQTLLRYQFSRQQQLLSTLTVVGLLLIFFLSMNDKPLPVDWYRFGIYFLVSHALVAVLAYLRKESLTDFWQFNKNLALQFLSSTLYTIILFAGLMVALYTVKILFTVDFAFPEEAYLFCLLALFFHTLFFIQGMERESIKDAGYPKALKFFAQYALLPLVVIYLLILYAYTIKIVISRELPQGGVAYLVLSLAVSGILAYLLIYPWHKKTGEKWINVFSRYFFPAVLPLNILLFAGIFRRIADYDVTENRYLVLVLAIWLAGISLYMILLPGKDIRVIPLSIAIVGLLISMGPWSVFAVAERSQKSRFEELLADHNLLSETGKLSGKATVSKDSYVQIFSILDYFNSREKLNVLFPYLAEGKDTVATERLHKRISDELSAHITSDTMLNPTFLSYNVKTDYQFPEAVSVTDFDYLWKIQPLDSVVTLQNGYSLVLAQETGLLILYQQETEIGKWDLKKKLKMLESKYGQSGFEVDPADMWLDSEINSSRCRFIFDFINFGIGGPKSARYGFSGHLLLKK